MQSVSGINSFIIWFVNVFGTQNKMENDLDNLGKKNYETTQVSSVRNLPDRHFPTVSVSGESFCTLN